LSLQIRISVGFAPAATACCGSGFGGGGALRCELYMRWFAAAIVMAIIVAALCSLRYKNQ
jgi:hypothetical protein